MLFGFRHLLFLPFIVLFWCNSAAAQSTEYFRGEAPVKSQSAQERRRAASEALLKVLVRMSGSEATRNSGQVQEQAKSAINYVEQFQYRQLNDEALREEGYSELLSLTFSPVVVRRILTEAQQPFWSVNRPTTLVWLVEDHPDDGKQLLNQQSDSPVVAALAQAASRRGLPLAYPLLDLQDQLAVTPESVWNIDATAIQEASERYQNDVILVGRFSRTSRGELWSTWQFFHAGSSRSYDSRVRIEDPGSEAKLGADALFPLAEFLAASYAIQPKLEAGGSLVMQLSGIKDFADFRGSLDYLGRLAAVSGVHLAAVRQDTLLLYLESEADIDRFMSVLALDNRMRPVVTTPLGPVWQQAPQGTLDNPLQFVWNS